MKKQNKTPYQKSRYTPDELKEFDKLLVQKLEVARKEFSFIQDSLTGRAENKAQLPSPKINPIEDGMELVEREKLLQLASRQRRFIKQLEDARVRIKNGTYGICVATGKLIDKDRLYSVPHTTHSIEAKLGKSQ